MAEGLEAQTALPPIPSPRDRGLGGPMGYLPVRYPLDVETSEGDAPEPTIIEHQWRTFQETKEDWIIRGGVVKWNGLSLNADQITIDTPTGVTDIWCKITLDADAPEGPTAVIEAATRLDEEVSALPEDTPTIKYWLIAEVFNEFPDGLFYPAVRQIQFEPIRLAVETGRPFCKVYLSPPDPKTYKLLGGIVSGGVGNITLPDIDLATFGAEPANGTHHWLNIDFEAYVEDDVLLPGGDVISATTGSGMSLPNNTIPTYDSPQGVLYISLGSWAENIFHPSNCGNVQVTHCPGNLSHTRS